LELPAWCICPPQAALSRLAPAACVCVQRRAGQERADREVRPHRWAAGSRGHVGAARGEHGGGGQGDVHAPAHAHDVAHHRHAGHDAPATRQPGVRLRHVSLNARPACSAPTTAAPVWHDCPCPPPSLSNVVSCLSCLNHTCCLCAPAARRRDPGSGGATLSGRVSASGVPARTSLPGGRAAQVGPHQQECEGVQVRGSNSGAPGDAQPGAAAPAPSALQPRAPGAARPNPWAEERDDGRLW
jgi:hypothetical protein